MSRFRGTHVTGLRRIAVFGVMMLAMACVPLMRNHGYVPTEQQLAQITVGVDTRDTTIAKLGPPTSGGVMEADVFYYISSTFRHYGPYAPEEVNRELLAITFYPAGRVRNIERFTLADGQVVVLSRRVTDDGIQDTTFIGQLLGSFGRIDAGSFVDEG